MYTEITAWDYSALPPEQQAKGFALIDNEYVSIEGVSGAVPGLGLRFEVAGQDRYFQPNEVVYLLNV